MAGVTSVPDRNIKFIEAKAGEVLKLGPITCRVLEDGSNTDNRFGAAELILPPKTPGPPPHWHEMHDETFFVTKGTVRFHVPDTAAGDGVDKEIIDAKAGDCMVVPTRAPHTFSNPTDEEAKIFFTTTPSFYINYFKLLSQLAKPDEPVPAEVNVQAMAMFATIVADKKPRIPE